MKTYLVLVIITLITACKFRTTIRSAEEQPHKIFTGSEIISGLAWDDQNGQLFISDYSGAIYRWNSGKSSLFKNISTSINGPLGLSFWQDTLMAFQPRDGRVINLFAPDEQNVVVCEWRGQRLNGPLAGSPYKDNLFIIDPVWDAKDLGFSGLFRLTPKHLLILADDALHHPAALTVSGDRLIVLNFRDEKIQWVEYHLPIQGDPIKKILFEVPSPPLTNHIPCGMDSDDTGNIYTAIPSGIIVISPEGSQLESINFKSPSSCVLSGDNSTLFVASDSTVWSIDLK